MSVNPDTGFITVIGGHDDYYTTLYVGRHAYCGVPIFAAHAAEPPPQESWAKQVVWRGFVVFDLDVLPVVCLGHAVGPSTVWWVSKESKL